MFSMRILSLTIILNAINCIALVNASYLQHPDAITPQEIAARHANFTTTFKWQLNNNFYEFVYRNGTTSYAFWLTLTLYEELDKETQSLCMLRQVAAGETTTPYFVYYFGDPNATSTPNLFSCEAKEYPSHEVSTQQPQNISSSELAQLIKDKRVLWRTGAGISATANVPTMNELEESLGIYDNEVSPSSLRKILKNPTTSADAFNHFCAQCRQAEPTAAHWALKDIVATTSAFLYSENVDLLHVKTGLQLPENCFANHTDELREALESIDVLIYVGIAYDYDLLIPCYKKENPNGIVVAFNIDTPSYLSGTDYLVREDIQISIPALAQEVGA